MAEVIPFPIKEKPIGRTIERTYYADEERPTLREFIEIAKGHPDVQGMHFSLADVTRRWDLPEHPYHFCAVFRRDDGDQTEGMC